MTDIKQLTASKLSRPDKVQRSPEFEKLLRENVQPYVISEPMLNINASSLGGCMRAVWYAKSGYKDERDAERQQLNMFIYGLGNAIETYITEILTHFRITKGKPRIRDLEYGISGEIDRVIIETADNAEVPVIVEIKTAWQYAYVNKVRELFDNIIDPGHYAQIQSYLMSDARFKYAYYILLNKNMNGGDKKYPPFVVYKVLPDTAEFERIKLWVNELKAHISSNTPPMRAYSNSDWQCKYCGFANVCWKDVDDDSGKHNSVLN